MFERLFKNCVEGKLIQRMRSKPVPKVIRIIDKLLSYPCIYFMSRTIPIKKSRIVFLTFRGAYDCNPKWITEELIRRKSSYQLVWCINKDASEDNFPSEVILSYRQSFELIKHISSAQIIIDNAVNLAHLGYKKKKGQVLIQTWHGSFGIKKFGRDTNKDKRWVRRAYSEARETDYCISNSITEENVFKDTFWKNNKILRLGHARNDILCEVGTKRLEDIRKKVFMKYSIEPSTKLCLYAPTYRDNGDFSSYVLDYIGLKNALETRFGGKWIVLTRFHYRVLEYLDDYPRNDAVIDVSTYSDIQEILTCIDVGITDYSSWICDYMLTKRPGFLFATDLFAYEKEDRELLYPLDTMPFPLAENNEQLLRNILSFDNEKYLEDCDAFLLKMGCVDDGLASSRICDTIDIIMNSI